jgi:hypothetical protein
VIVDNNSLWLGVKVGTDVEMTPRVQIGSVPFASQALTVPDGSITTVQLADGAVTVDKIANNAGEPSRIQNWVADTNTTFNAGGAGSTNVIEPDITVTVAAGKAYYYAVEYQGTIQYLYSERVIGNTGFYDFWHATLLADKSPLTSQSIVVVTGYRQDWAAIANSLYWGMTYDAAWLVRLTEGTHDLKVQFGGYSDNTMNYVHVLNQRLQVMRVP